jgi:hypothetical protein
MFQHPYSCVFAFTGQEISMIWISDVLFLLCYCKFSLFRYLRCIYTNTNVHCAVILYNLKFQNWSALVMPGAVAYPEIFYGGGGGFKKFSSGQRAERTGIGGR